jgi:hypothetical protein
VIGSASIGSTRLRPASSLSLAKHFAVYEFKLGGHHWDGVSLSSGQNQVVVTKPFNAPSPVARLLAAYFLTVTARWLYALTDQSRTCPDRSSLQ